MRQLAAILALVGATSLGGCVLTVDGEFSWSGSAGIFFGSGISVSNGEATTEQKQVELEFQVNIGDADGASIDSMDLRQRWSTTTTAQNSTSTFKDTVIGNTATSTDPYFDASVTYTSAQRIFGPEQRQNLIVVRYAVTLQYGWNEFLVTGSYSVTDSKGNPRTFDFNEEPTYIYGDFGDRIPLKVTLAWNELGADFDLIVRESSTGQWVFWNNMGYNPASINCFQYDSSDIADNTNRRIACYQGEFPVDVSETVFDGDGYVVGNDRAAGVTFGSLDKDDTHRRGPEIFTLDPPLKNAATHPDIPAGGYADGDQFDVYIAYYFAKTAFVPAPSEADAAVGIYLNGSAEPSNCYNQAGMTPDALDEGNDENYAFWAAALEAQHTGGHARLTHVGTLTYSDPGTGGSFAWDDTNGEMNAATATGGFCPLP